LSGSLARRRVGIEDLHTEIVDGATPADQLFKVKALLVVPASVSNEDLRNALEPLTKEMTVDIAL
jgi:glycine cleavage system regulatory protein